MLGYFYFGAPLALILGGPLSGALMELDGLLGLRGWQWMFLVEGLAASVVGVWAYYYLPNRPKDAKWLGQEEKVALLEALKLEDDRKWAHQSFSLLTNMRNPQILHLALVYLLIQVSVYGVTFYLPAQVERLLGRKAGLEVGLVTAIPWLCALGGLCVIPRLATAWGARHGVATGTLLLAAAGILASGSASPVLALAGLCVAATGFIAAQPIFWTFPSDRYTGSTAAAVLALINSCGALGGFIAPNIRSWADRHWGAGTGGVSALALATFAGALLFFLVPRSTERTTTVRVAAAQPRSS
jgi:MFS family permease